VLSDLTVASYPTVRSVRRHLQLFQNPRNSLCIAGSSVLFFFRDKRLEIAIMTKGQNATGIVNKQREARGNYYDSHNNTFVLIFANILFECVYVD